MWPCLSVTSIKDYFSDVLDHLHSITVSALNFVDLIYGYYNSTSMKAANN